MALVHANYHTNPLENSRLSQRELLARIFGHHGTEGELQSDYEDSSSDSGSDYEMEECHEGMISLFSSCTVDSGKSVGHFVVKRNKYFKKVDWL